MARPLLLVTLVLFALVTVAVADSASEAAAAAVPSFGPASDDQIGTSDDGAGEAHAEDSGAVAAEAPIGGPVPPGAYAYSPEAPHSGAGAMEVSAVAAVGVAIAGFFF